MDFKIIKSSEARDKLRRERQIAYRENIKSMGNLVSYRMPSYYNNFPKIKQALLKSDHKNKFRGIDYYIAAKCIMLPFSWIFW